MQYVPGGQRPYVMFPSSVGCATKAPSAQKYPAAQSPAGASSCVLSQKRPGVQAMHAAVPLAGWKVPAAHGVGWSEPSGQ